MNKLDNDYEVDQTENTLEYARCFKKKLRFDIGETVFLKSDEKQEISLTVSKFEIQDTSYDYVVSYIHPKKKIVMRDFFLDKVLTPKI
jgi:hypothetical protein